MSTVPRQKYVDLYGPTVGDRFRLADTELICEVERTLLVPGDETVYGGGKTVRDGMGQVPGLRNDEGVLDTVITSVIVMDPVLGILKADIGIKDGRIAGVGKAGNPFVMDGVDPHLVVGAGTEVIAGEGLIATPGAIDPHVHFLSPAQAEHALSNGVTTLIGGGTGPADGSKGVTSTPGPWHLARMLEACDALPVNVGLSGKGNSSRPGALREQIEAGACALKVHEDYGATTSVIRCALEVADEYDVQIAIHTDSLNECGYVADTIDAIDGRTIHTYHTEGAGGGHAPDIIAVAGLANVLPSSTNPTKPFTTDTVDNLFYMTTVTHHLNPQLPEDVAFAQSRIRAETIAAEDVLQDLGAISMFSSDSMAMGRIGETVLRCFQTADKMKRQTGKLKEDAPEHDNARVLRYLAKLTINPAITHGFAEHLGSLERGKIADIVLWPTNMFGAKPKMVLKGGMIAWSIMGDPNGSIPTPEPVLYRPAFGARSRARARTSFTLMSRAAVERGVPEALGLDKGILAVGGCRALQKRHMIRNDALPKIEVDPETYHRAPRWRRRVRRAPARSGPAVPRLAVSSADERDGRARRDRDLRRDPLARARRARGGARIRPLLEPHGDPRARRRAPRRRSPRAVALTPARAPVAREARPARGARHLVRRHEARAGGRARPPAPHGDRRRGRRRRRERAAERRRCGRARARAHVGGRDAPRLVRVERGAPGPRGRPRP